MEAGTKLKRDAGRRQHTWRPEAAYLAALALLTIVLFASGSLDIRVARWFYHSRGTEHWPLARQFSLDAAVSRSHLDHRHAGQCGSGSVGSELRASAWRRPAVQVLLAVVIGPGLLGNVLFKDHWQHPRPRDLVEFGGPLHYVPAPLIGTEGGASFPCGHCTVGFLYACGWWLWKRRRPRWAVISLGCGIALGLLLGVGRMASVATTAELTEGRQVTVGVAIPALRKHASGQRLAAGAALLGGAAVLIALFVTPHGTALTRSVTLASLPGTARTLEVEADKANIDLVLVDGPATRLDIDGELHGFGLPGSRLDARVELVARPRPALRYQLEARGWLSDVDGRATSSPDGRSVPPPRG